MGAGDAPPRPRRCTGCCSARPGAGRRARAERAACPTTTPRRSAALRALAAARARGRAGRPARPVRRLAPPAPAAPRRAARPPVRPRARHRLAAHVLQRADRRRRRTTRPGVAASRRSRGTDDEADATDPPGRRAAPGRADRTPAPLPSPMADLPVGAAFGTLVHAVLEAPTSTAPDLLGRARPRAAREQLRRGPVAGLDPDGAGRGAAARSLRTPLGPLAGGLRLADIAPRDRLAELDFELPLAGGDDAAAPPTSTARRRSPPLLRRHLPAGRPAAPLPGRAGRAGARPAAAARLPHRQHRRGAAAARAAGSSSSTTRPTGSARSARTGRNR